MTSAALLGPAARPLWTPPGVYAPQADTYLLARALRAEGVGAGMDVLDVGTGSGALALLAAGLGARVAATDISWRAVAAARINAVRTGRRVQVRRGDLTDPVGTRRFDVVVSNPPYVPAPGPDAGTGAGAGAGSRAGRRRGAAALAWDAGRDGRELVDRMCARTHRVLKRHGVLLMVHSGLCGVDETLVRLSEAGLSCRVADRADVPFGPVLTRRLPWLRAQGLVARGEDREELFVIRAERP
jgi:release factor glutamine methyltransferase